MGTLRKSSGEEGLTKGGRGRILQPRGGDETTKLSRVYQAWMRTGTSAKNLVSRKLGT